MIDEHTSSCDCKTTRCHKLQLCVVLRQTFLALIKSLYFTNPSNIKCILLVKHQICMFIKHQIQYQKPTTCQKMCIKIDYWNIKSACSSNINSSTKTTHHLKDVHQIDYWNITSANSTNINASTWTTQHVNRRASDRLQKHSWMRFKQVKKQLLANLLQDVPTNISCA